MCLRSILITSVLSISLVGAGLCGSIGRDNASANMGTLEAPPGNDSSFNTATPGAGLTTYAVMSGGVERRYSVYAPGPRADGRPYPVVIDIHGTGSNPEEELDVSGMARAAEERRFVVILPVACIPHPGGGAAWNIPADPREADDVRYIADMLDDVSQRLDLDSCRVFVTGFSGGARLASEVASRLSNRIAALGAVGGLRAPSGTGRAVPVIAFHGTGDPVNPFAGGGPTYWRYGLGEALERWGIRNRCAVLDDTVRVVEGVRCVRGASCFAGGELQLYILDGAGHVWPGSRFALPADRFGRMTDAIDATSLMLDFFSRHPLPEACANPGREQPRSEVQPETSRMTGIPVF